MYGSERERRRSRHRRRRNPEPEDRSDESTPRSYDREARPYVDPQDELVQGTAGLQLDTEETETYALANSPPESARNRREDRGKGKGRQTREWSDWVWDPQSECFYCTRETSLGSGEYEYQYHYPSTSTAEAPDRSHSQSDPSAEPYYSSKSGTHGTQDSSKVEVAESTVFSEPPLYGAGTLAQASVDSGESHSYGAVAATTYPPHDSVDSFSVHSSERHSSASYPAVTTYPGTGYPPTNYPAASYPAVTAFPGTGYPATDSPPTSFFPPTSPSTSGFPTMYQSGLPASSSSYSAGAPDYTNPTSYGTGYGQSAEPPRTKFPPVFLPYPIDKACLCDRDKKLCGVLVWPKDPKPNDGRITDRTYYSSPAPDKMVVRGPSGQNCGPLVLPGVTPGPRPSRSQDDYEEAERKWEKGYREWSQITCPCGYGYFNIDGVWISGAEARGDNLLNPLWEDTGGKAPSVTGRQASLEKRRPLRLHERDPERRSRSR